MDTAMTKPKHLSEVNRMVDAIGKILASAPSASEGMAAIQIATGYYLYETSDTQMELMATTYNYIRLLTDQVQDAVETGWERETEQ